MKTHNPGYNAKMAGYFLILIFASHLIQAAPSSSEVVSSVQIVARQEDTGDVDVVTAIQNSESAPEALANWGNLVAHIFTQIAQVPVALLTGIGVIKPAPTPAPVKESHTTPTPTIIQVVLAPTPAPVSYHQGSVAHPQQQQYYQQVVAAPVRAPQPRPQPQPQPQVNEKPDGGEDSGDGEDNDIES